MKRKIACVLLGAVSLQLLSCGQHESNETLTEPNYVLQEYETTKSENGYSIVNDFMVYDEPSPSGLYVYYPYVEEKKKGVNYLDDMYIGGKSQKNEENLKKVMQNVWRFQKKSYLCNRNRERKRQKT